VPFSQVLTKANISYYEGDEELIMNPMTIQSKLEGIQQVLHITTLLYM
jgi:hypothetical protein